MQSRNSYEQPHLEYMAVSPEQVAESMARLGPLRDRLYRAFQEAIARAEESQQESNRPVIVETKKGDSEDEAVLK